MIPTEVVQARELRDVLHDAAGHLSPTHVAALLAHPHAVRAALAAAADALSMSDRERPSAVETIESDAPLLLGAAESRRRLTARAREAVPETLLTSDELAAQAGLKSRQSVHDWRKKGRIVGWQNARRGYVFPAAQFDGRNRPLPGLDRIAGQFGDGYAAWVWLSTPRPSLDGAMPLELLAGGEIDRVTDALRGDRQGDFA